MRLVVPIAIIALSAAAIGGCGGSSTEGESSATGPAVAPQGGAATAPSEGSAPAGASAQHCGNAGEASGVHASGVACGKARSVVAAWEGEESCAGSQGISHISCKVGPYLCISARTERGLSVSCARPGRSISFISRR